VPHHHEQSKGIEGKNSFVKFDKNGPRAGQTIDDVRSKSEADHRNTWGYWEMMLNAPFLELAYFVGEANLKQAIDKVKAETPFEGVGQKFTAPNVIGIAGPVEQLAIRGGVVELRTEGEAFCGEPSRLKPRARALGNIAYSRFVHFAGLLNPVYGAILVEYSLENPDELRGDPRSLAFQNFYLAKRALDERSWLMLHEIVGESVYRDVLPHGLYVSMTTYFNPEAKGVASVEAQALSEKIAELLARSLRD
jgi:hypothetical protein